MAEYTRAAAFSVDNLYGRRITPSGDSRFYPRPFYLVTYDDGQLYLEPANNDLVPNTWAEVNPINQLETVRVVENEPFVDPDLAVPITGIR